MITKEYARGVRDAILAIRMQPDQGADDMADAVERELCNCRVGFSDNMDFETCDLHAWLEELKCGR